MSRKGEARIIRSQVPLAVFDSQTDTGYLLKAGHFVSSITYREGLMALPRQGQLIDLR